jgi:hypothetical protein
VGAMCLSHFGLDEPPFRITPHTDFFVAGANRGATPEAQACRLCRQDGRPASVRADRMQHKSWPEQTVHCDTIRRMNN